ncbi:enoyl-CoA hydratase/isomerase family protein [Mycobacterium sp. SMC-4]|uniref:enoyl-CoA hydratase/isomerase family protein n=1 Tax=Mycobacterium sp. SMC-4 TaxID=2857059 RepID=UPI003CFDA37E
MTGVDIRIDAAGIAHLMMTRTGARNALSRDQAARIARAAKALNDNPAVRVTVLSSSMPDFFCVGADLKERRTLDERGLMEARRDSTAATQALLDLSMPTIAAVRGMALGGGAELALTCDLIVGDPTTVVGFPETGVGIIPGGGGTQLLPRKIGNGRAAEMIFTGRRLDADEAQRYGFLDVLDAADAEAAALRLATTIASKSSEAQRNAKSALRDGQNLPLADALLCEDRYWRASACSQDYQEGLAAFSEKRPPVWPAASAAPTTEIRHEGATA